MIILTGTPKVGGKEASRPVHSVLVRTKSREGALALSEGVRTRGHFTFFLNFVFENLTFPGDPTVYQWLYMAGWMLASYSHPATHAQGTATS